MSTALLARVIDVFTSRLATLSHLLAAAEDQWRAKDRDPADLLEQRIVADMFPLPQQIVFACNQANQFAAWCAGETWDQPEPADFDWTGLRAHVEETRQRVARATAADGDAIFEHEKRVIFPEFYLALTGREYVQDFLLPNLYFHLTTGYDLLRMQGVQIGKADYMHHLMDRVRPLQAA